MTRITYSLKMALGWICWHIWSCNSGWIQDVRWLNNLLLPWAGFYAHDMGYARYFEKRYVPGLVTAPLHIIIAFWYFI
jgi:hypothetical protein